MDLQKDMIVMLLSLLEGKSLKLPDRIEYLLLNMEKYLRRLILNCFVYKMR